MPPVKKPAPGPLTKHAPKASWAAVALSALSLIGWIFGWWTTNHPPTQHQVAVAAAPAAKKAATAQLRTVIASATNAAANASPGANESCTVPVGQGTMGACGPQTSSLALAIGKVTRTLGRSVHAASVTTIRGHLIGADVSSYQGCQTQFRLAFVITKATESTGYTDRCLGQNLAAAKRSHVPVSAYDFLRPGSSSATAEGAHFVQAVKAAGGINLPPVADVEATRLGASQTHDYVCQWVKTVRAGLHVSRVIIYTGYWFWPSKVGGDDCAGTILWISAYGSYALIPPTWGGGSLNPGSRYNARAPLWQYSDGQFGPYPRVQQWDTDVYFGSRSQLAQLAGLTKPCSKRTACRMGRRHKRIHNAILTRCHHAKAPRKACRHLRGRNRYIHRYVRRHHLTLVTK